MTYPECQHCGAWLCAPRTTTCAKCEDKINNYANAMIKADKVRGYPSRIQDERAPDGRLIFDEMNGSLKRSIHEEGSKE